MHQETEKPETFLRSFSIRKLTSKGQSPRVTDVVASEEPLDVRLSYSVKDSRRTESFALVMRTPGHDRELVAGLLLSEGVVAESGDIEQVRHLGAEQRDEILVDLGASVDVDAWRLKRNSFLNSSCGVCSKTQMAQIVEASPSSTSAIRIPAEVFFALPDRLAAEQPSFTRTGALHAAALVSCEGRIERVFEDIGRHNALDKLLGWCLLENGLPLTDQIVLLSSRSSFELVQKVSMAHGSILATVGGPSSLAITTARSLGMTLVGFLRDGRCNVYSGEWRVDSK